MDLSGYLLAWRTTALPDREVIDALVHPAHAGPSSALAAALADWPGGHYWSDEPDGRHLVLTRLIGRRRRTAWAVHLLLLAATLFTTTFVGAVLLGAIPFDPNPLALLLGTYPFPRDFIHAWAKGLPFSAPLLAILSCHELGHYVTARHYQLDVSLPFFIPQLDGGHILYSAVPRWHRRTALGFWALIVALGVYWRGWLLWGGLVLLLSRGRLGHPPVLDVHRPLPRSRRLLAWTALILFLITFTPIPFRL